MFTIMVLVGFKEGVEFQFPWQKQLFLFPVEQQKNKFKA